LTGDVHIATQHARDTVTVQVAKVAGQLVHEEGVQPAGIAKTGISTLTGAYRT
jgi:hypothetical protein